MQIPNQIQKIILGSVESMKSFFHLTKHNTCGANDLLKFHIFLFL